MKVRTQAIFFTGLLALVAALLGTVTVWRQRLIEQDGCRTECVATISRAAVGLNRATTDYLIAPDPDALARWEAAAEALTRLLAAERNGSCRSCAAHSVMFTVGEEPERMREIEDAGARLGSAVRSAAGSPERTREAMAAAGRLLDAIERFRTQGSAVARELAKVTDLVLTAAIILLLILTVAIVLRYDRTIARPLAALTGLMARADTDPAAVAVPDGLLGRRDEFGALDAAFRQLLDRLGAARAEAVEREQRHRDDAAELDAIINAMPGMVFYKDLENRLLRVNRNLAAGYRMTPEELAGKSLFELHPREQAQAYWDDDLDVVRHRRPKLNIEEPWPTPTGLRWALTNKVPHYDREGKIIGIIGLSVDITERKLAQQELAVSEAKYRTLFESSRDGIVQTDLTGRIVDCNDAYAAALGYATAELPGRAHWELTPEAWRAAEQAIIRDQVLTHGYSTLFEQEYVRKDGTFFPVSMRLWLVRDPSGAPAGYWAIVRDVTERKQAETRLAEEHRHLAEANRRLRELDQLKDGFLATVSHELRTPLTVIKGAARNVLDGIAGAVSDRQGNFLRMIDANAERLNRFIDDLLDLAKLESGRIEMYRVRGDLAGLIREHEPEYRLLAEPHRQALLVRLDDPLPPVWFDHDWIKAVVGNLVGNAVKFTPDGGTVTIEAVAGGGQVTVAVRDTGIGIPAADQPRIFEKFHQLGREARRGVKGTGLGLAISRQVIELHGGRLWVESVPDRGSVFAFSLPTGAPVGKPVSR